MRIPMLSKASARAEIAERYRKSAKRAARRAGNPKPRTQAAIRIGELTRLFDDRWGRVHIPEGNDGYQAARIMVHHIGHLRRDVPRRISAWLQCCTPWMDLAERENLIRDVEECPIKWTADKLAWKLRVNEATRSRLRLTTIGAIDFTKAQRAARRAERKRVNRQASRRAAGTRPRAEYLAGLPKSRQLWVEAGISRATWYRRQRET
ncbi:MAG: hypothetical protein Q7R45_07260 [Sulfuricaulis sp.]|nr:hypothetical protein [Sulfuricaulis sp.]